MLFRLLIPVLFACEVSAQSIEQVRIFTHKMQKTLEVVEQTYGRASALKSVPVMYIEARAGDRDKMQVRLEAQSILDNAESLPEEIEEAFAALDFRPIGHPPYDEMLRAFSENAPVFANVVRSDLDSTRRLLNAVDQRDRDGFVDAFNSYQETALVGENMAVLVLEASLALGDPAGPAYWLTAAQLAQTRASRDTFRSATLPKTSPERSNVDIPEIWAGAAEEKERCA